MIGAALLHLLVAIVGVTLVWALQLRTRNAGVVDAAWALLIGAGGVLYALSAGGHPAARALLALLAGLWAIRLGGYLAWRNRRGPEERRYAELRREWGPAANVRMLLFFQLQALIAWLIAFTFLPLAWRQDLPPLFALGAGAAVGLCGIVGEALADEQLRRFKGDPRNAGRVCNTGLWRYSRHPNFFFECVFWLAWPVLAIGAPWWGLALIGPALIAWLLLKVSGVPTLEAPDAAGRRAGYAEYVRRTSAFIPWPPRKG